MGNWFKSGTPWIWLNAAAVSASLIAVVGLLGLIAARGLGHFWPADIAEIEYLKEGQTIRLIGEIRDQEDVPRERLVSAGLTVPEGVESVRRVQLKSRQPRLHRPGFRLDPWTGYSGANLSRRSAGDRAARVGQCLRLSA